MSRASAVCLLLLALVLAGCDRGKDAGNPGTNKPGGKRIYTRQEFQKEFLGATLDEVRAKLGPPDEVIASEDRWEYRKRTRNGRAGEVDDYVSISHKAGRVVSAGPD